MTPEEKTLWYWVRERENVRIWKEDGRAQKLWTSDRILQTYRFCNVRREDDRVTRWITKNIKERFYDNKNLWFMLCIARMINWPPTLRKLIDTAYAWPIDQWDAMTFSHTIDHIEGKTFTGAYIIPAGPSGGSKARFLADKVLGSLWKDKAKFSYCFNTAPSMREVHALLMEYSGWGQSDKYLRVKNKEGKPRSIYKSETAF